VTKVVAVDVPACEFCTAATIFQDDTSVVNGRVYTVQEYAHAAPGWVLIRLVEIPMTSEEWWCHCGFREIDGDSENWERMMRENRPRTRELEPA
jgi:hypothetical protein